ncbi:MAG: 2-oxoacid:acceptor oxidoreductase family protein [Planctomycetes bacterium]|nr:2-oxoacid:acceptor oxidoreductase family protein [Planctomycetota bacterium]
MPTPTPPPLNVSIALCGEAGAGILHAGRIITVIAARCGLLVSAEEMPPREFQCSPVAFRLRVASATPPRTPRVPVELCIALDGGASAALPEGLRRGCFCILDSDAPEPVAEPDGRIVEWVRAPIRRIALEASASTGAAAFGAAGIVCGLLNLTVESDMLADIHIGAREPVAFNPGLGKAFFDAFHFAKKEFESKFTRRFEGAHSNREVSVTSIMDEAARGLFVAGIRYVCGTPSGTVGAMLSAVARGLSPGRRASECRVESAETPAIAAGLALGASFGGVPSTIVVESSRFSEVCEAVATASVAEIPLHVIVLEGEAVIGGGFGATEAGGLLSAVFSGPSQSTRALFSVADHARAARIAFESVKASEEFQLPSVLLIQDRAANILGIANLRNMDGLVRPARRRPAGVFDAAYRYETAPTGISAMAVPGDPGMEFAATPREHDRRGLPVEGGKLRESMQMKRLRKSETMRHQLESSEFSLNVTGDLEVEDFEFVAIGSGLTSETISEAVALASRESIRILHLHLFAIKPLPRKLFLRIRDRFEERQLLVFDENPMGELAAWLKLEVGLVGQSFKRADGLPFRAHEVLQRFREASARR